MSRSGNSLRNAGASLGGQLLGSLLKFICRTVFIYTLGQEFLGISGLYSNVITILNITELGFSTVITYSLYKPLADNDRETVRSLMAFFRRIYRLVGLGVLLLGLAIMPFLTRLMTGVTDKVNIYHYYLLYLTQTVVSYLFFAYKSVLLIADQKKYLTDLAVLLCQAAVCALQIAALVILRSFLAYTVLAILQGVAQNILTAVLTDRRYPWLKGESRRLKPEEKKDLSGRVYATFLQKVSTAVGTATDNLIISAFVGVTSVGLYSNYALIITTVQNALGGVFRSLTASVGNLWASGDSKRSGFVFRSLDLLNSFLVCLCGVCFLTMFRPFIILWAGEEYLLDQVTVLIIVLNFATNYLQNVVQVFRNATGLFVVGKYRSVINAALNLGLSLLFVRFWDMAGVFLASIISRLLTVWWYDGWVLCRRGLKTAPWGYYCRCGLCIAVMLLSGAVSRWACGSMGVSWLSLLASGAVGVLACTAVYGVLFAGREETRYIFCQIARKIGKSRK